MPEAIQIQTPGGSYPVHLGHGLGNVFEAALADVSEVVLITDENVYGLEHFTPWREGLAERDRFVECVVPPGEGAKSLESFGRCLSACADRALSRKAVVVALGGGVVGDLGGYVAASYLRGIAYLQVPTTLLAMVDSSVGGKTGINLPEGKNLVGAFYQPQAVVADLEALETLPPREHAAGIAEVIKYGLIRDPGILETCSRPDGIDYADLVRRCIQIKADVVSADERETSGLRAILNFGHTLAHAIEQVAGYGKLLHGEAVAIGMVGATWLSIHKTGLDPAWQERVEGLLETNQLPVRLPGLKYADLEPVIRRDKKATGGRVTWVLLEDAGRVVRTADVEDELVRDAVAYLAGN